MARTNGPTAPPAPHWTEAAQGQQGYGQPVYGQPPQPNTYANQGYGAPAQPQYAPAAPQPSYPQHGQQQPADAYHYPDSAYGADSYSQPTLGSGGQHGYSQPPAQPQWGEPPAPSYAPRFEPYTPPTAPSGRAQTQPPPFAPYPQPEPPTQPPVHHSREPRIVGPERGYAPAPELRGPAYDQHPNWPAEPEFYPQEPAADASQGYGYAQQGGYQPPPQPSFGAQPDWPSTNGYDQGQLSGYQPPAPPQQRGYPEPGFADPDGYAAPGYAPPQFAPHGYGEGEPGGYAPPAAVQSQALEHEYDPDEVEYEDEGRGRGGRKMMMMIAAGLVGVLGIGGAVAFGYSTFFGSGGSTGTPVVKSETQPSKIKPLDPGGKKFAHTDSKILGRLNDGSSAAPASEGDDEGGPRKVTTMVVGRDGSIVPVYGSPPPAQAEAPAASGPVVVTPPRPAPQASTGVPGLTIVDGFGGRGGAMAPVGSGAATANSGTSSASARPATVAPVVTTTAPPAASAPPVRPQVIARAEPAASPPPPAQVAPAKPAARPPVKDPVAKINAIRGDASRVSGDGGTAGAGYVAVLASVPASSSSRMDALKQFADLQQRYPSQLQNKTPDVQAADLAGKGSFHRLIVGPPGSRQQASALCSELKSVGYASCWVKAY